MKKRPTLKAFNFDLDTNLMTAHLGDYTKGYYQIRRELKNLGFEHRQGSGYISKQKLTDSDVFRVVQTLSQNIPWLASCVEKFDVTSIEKQFDMTSVIKNPTATPITIQFNASEHEHER